MINVLGRRPRRLRQAHAGGGEGAQRRPAPTLDVKLVQLVRLLRAGEPVKMSKRSGEFVTLREVVDEVGRDAVRFMMLYRKNDAPLDFDLAKVIEQSKDNPVFYVQYGHARALFGFPQCARGAAGSAARRRGEGCVSRRRRRSSDSTDAGELALMKRLAVYPRVVEAAAAGP